MNPLNSPTLSSGSPKPLIRWALALAVIVGSVTLVYFLAKKTPPKEAPLEAPVTQEPPNPLAEEKKQEEEIPSSTVYYVNPVGDDNADGRSSEKAFKSIQKAVDQAEPGESIELAEGEYRQDIITKKDGTSDKRITIRGPSKAILKGGGKGRVIEINHDYITLEGFTIDGHYGSGKKEKDYRDKLIFVLGKESKRGVTGVRIEKMTIQNAGGECIRLRYFAEKNEIAYSTIKNCGIYDFAFESDGKNGEGIYIGTSPEQVKDGGNPTKDVDVSKNNWIHHNTIDTQGNECVDIKEGSIKNIVEYNSCTGQKDKDSGGMGSRGNENVFRHNTIFGNRGAGIRVGGDKKEYGINNFIYENTIKDNKSGGIKIQRKPQAKICGNTFSGNKGGNFVGNHEDDSKNTSRC